MTFEVKHGSFGYGKGTVLNDISFSVSSGEVLAVLGSNGVGKTTLLKCMMGLQKWRQGESLLDGKNIAGLSHKELWQTIAYVPQSKASAFSFSALDMVVMGRSSRLGMLSRPTEEDEAAAVAAMEDIGILHLKDKMCNSMSGGELQMVLIARALTAGPKMLVLDELVDRTLFHLDDRDTAENTDLRCGKTATVGGTHGFDHVIEQGDDAGGNFVYGTAIFAEHLVSDLSDLQLGHSDVLSEADVKMNIYS